MFILFCLIECKGKAVFWDSQKYRRLLIEVVATHIPICDIYGVSLENLSQRQQKEVSPKLPTPLLIQHPTQLVVPMAVKIAVITDASICSVHLIVSFLLIAYLLSAINSYRYRRRCRRCCHRRRRYCHPGCHCHRQWSSHHSIRRRWSRRSPRSRRSSRGSPR